MAIQSLSREELRRLLGVARASRERDWLMILVAFWHGLRASEVVALKADDFRDGYLSVQRLKGSMKTIQPLIYDDDPLFSETPALIDYIAGLHANQRIFPLNRTTFWRIAQRHAAAAGLPAHVRNTKMLKHSIAMQTIHSAGIENVRQYLGHKSISSTGSYLKVTDSEASACVQRAAQSLTKL